MEIKNIEYLGDYINGKFLVPQSPEEEISNASPGDLKDHVYQGKVQYSHVGEAIESANFAYKKWKRTSYEERKNLLLKLKEEYKKNIDLIAQSISRETGKPLWESTGEVNAMIGKIDITVNHSMELVQTVTHKEALPNVDGVIRFVSRGVMAVIGPFNFPGHLANGHIVPALLTGNTVIFKPSEKTPLTGQLMAQCFHDAGFPEGVFNLVQGTVETGKRLVSDLNIDGVLFTGSYDVGLKIKQDTLSQHWKILALEMGGKNTTIVWNDADLEKAVYETLVGSYLTSGQRCSCTSKVVLHEAIKEEFLDKFHSAAKKIKVGHWSESPFMGPLISAESREKYIRFQEIAVREGAESLMRGKALELEREGYYISPSINLVKQVDEKSVYQNNEIFGPNVAVYSTQELEESFKISNMGGYGLVSAIFTSDKAIFQKALEELKVGLLNWNRTTNGASSKLPFGGRGKSGNDRPSAHFAVNYCTVPVASLEDHGTFDASKTFPGLGY
ncbi:MAG: succinylglutamate-semialdehyde dehydrogenase [Bdellovibrionaceae bacterium]|jgi:succinylglutamic semialdehyde dehydrogenase|nr:succinylglutamate-semialdehyde dehydrogenase [Pseudobdellovibrionaceae bacterium]